MKIKVLTNLSLKTGEHKSGDVLDLEEALARQLIDAHLVEAEAASHADPLAPSDHQPSLESAAVDDSTERATLPRARPRGV